MRIPNKATARMPIDRPDTYKRLLIFMRNFTCDRQPVHTLGRYMDILVSAPQGPQNALSPSNSFIVKCD